MAFVSEAEEFFEAVPKRMIGRGPAQMPFADYSSDVASVLQGLGYGRLFRWEADRRVFVAMPDRVVFVAEARGDTPRDESGSRGTAVRPVAYPLVKRTPLAAMESICGVGISGLP